MKLQILVASLLLPIFCTAQYNDSLHYYVGLNANGNINKTATSEAYVLSNSIRGGIRRKKLSANIHGSWLYGKQQDKLTNNDVVTTIDGNVYRPGKKYYYWGLGNFTSNYSLKINSQYQGGAGMAYSFIDTKKSYVNLSDGVLYEYSDIIVADTQSTYSTYRNSLRLSFKFEIVKTVTISSMSFYQQALTDNSDYILKSNTTLAIKMLKWVSLTTSYTYNKFNRTGRETALFNYGLKVEHYF